MKNGTKISATVQRVVDGDTIRVILPDGSEESLRILSLDTEESFAGSSKPVTPWGKAAKARAAEFFLPNDKVELEFPGNEPLEEALVRYRGNYGRLLVFVYKNDIDFQETMIREGYSPYFVKYGNADLQDNHLRYMEAEREAQRNFRGVWNQLEVNGAEVRNYAALCTWWHLRADIIEHYRSEKSNYDTLLNSRLDFTEILKRAKKRQKATIFTELRTIKRITANSAVIQIGSRQQPFSLFLPDIESEVGQAVINLMNLRYISSDETHPRRSYAYVTGKMSTYKDQPQIVIDQIGQITDEIPNGIN